MSAVHRFLNKEHWPVIAVFVLAFGIRLFACLNTAIVNPDGIHYIHQARAILSQDWSSLTDCHLKYLSILPFLIAAGHLIFHDWIAAGRFISLCFSVATLIPLFFILKQFFNRSLSILTLMVYALIPVFVSRSADIVRDPVFWFLICMGMLFFINQMKSTHPKRYHLQLILSNSFFLLSIWARFEGAMFIGVSALFLLVSRLEHKYRRIIYFCAPMVVLAAGAVALSVFMESTAFDIHKLSKISLIHEFTLFFSRYQEVLASLQALASRETGRFYEFLHQVESVIWVVPLGALLITILEGFFYPYALFLFLGFGGLRQRISQDRRIGYFLWLCVSSVLVLYIHLLNTWLIFNRFLAILIYPACILVGLGISRFLIFLEHKCKLKPAVAMGLVIIFILSFGLGKNLKPNHQDKIPYRRAGEQIAKQKESQQIARIAGVHSTIYEWVFFYAHRDHATPICAREHILYVPPTYAGLLKRMRRHNVRYLLFEEKLWVKSAFNLKETPYEKDFRVIGKWYHKDTGDLLLLERMEG